MGIGIKYESMRYCERVHFVKYLTVSLDVYIIKFYYMRYGEIFHKPKARAMWENILFEADRLKGRTISKLKTENFHIAQDLQYGLTYCMTFTLSTQQVLALLLVQYCTAVD